MVQIAESLITQAHRHPHQTAIVLKQEGVGKKDVKQEGVEQEGVEQEGVEQDYQTVQYCYQDLLEAAQTVADRIRETANRSRQTADLHPAVQHRLRVGIILPNSLEFLEIFLGVTIAGGVVMVFDPKWSVLQMQKIIQRSAPDLLFVEAEWAALIQSQAEQTVPLIVVPDLSSSQLSFVPELSQCAEPKSPIGYGNWCKAGLSSKSSSQQSSQQSSRVTLPRLASPYGSSFSLAEAILAELPDAAEAAFYVGFTSGTTGTPKGIVRSHLSWVESFAASQQEFGTCAHDRILVPGALTHSLSLYAVLEGLNAGATVYLLPRFSAKGVLRLLATQSITVLTAVPTLLKAIAKLLLNKSIRCSNVRMVIAGGSKLEPSLRSELPLAFPTAEILEYFGALELSFISLASSRERVPLTSVGRSFHGVEVSIRKQTEPGAAAIGEIGWIGVKSQLLSLGNLEPEQETNYRKLEGWATVGDLGWQDADGYLYVSGREQDMIISGGINVYPMEIETILRHLPEIAEVVVVGIPEPPNLKPSNLRAINSKATETEPSSSKLSSSKLPHQEISHRGQLICAAIQWTGEPLARAELLRYLRQYLPTTKCPRYFITVDQFPTTPSGKVMRSALKEQMMMQLMPQPLGSDRTSAEDVPGSGATPNHF